MDGSTDAHTQNTHTYWMDNVNLRADADNKGENPTKDGTTH